MSGTADSTGLRWGNIILVLLILAGAAVIGGAWLILPPVYTAETLLEVTPLFQGDPLTLNRTVVPVEAMDRWTCDQAQMVRDLQVLDAALRDPGLRATSWYTAGVKRDGAAGLFETLEEDLTASPVHDSSLVKVTFTAANQKDAMVILNTVVRKYLETAQVRSKTELHTQLETMKKERDLLAKQLDQIHEEKEQYISSSIKEPGVVSGLNVTGEQWRALATEASRLLAEQLTLKTAWDNVKDMDPDQLDLSPDDRQRIEQDPEITKLRELRLNLELGLDSGLTPSTQPATRPASVIIEEIDRKLAAIRKQRESELQAYRICATETAWLNALAAQLAVEERVQDFKGAQRDLDTKLARVARLEERAEMLKRQHDRVADFVQELHLLDASQDTISVRQLGAAVEPVSPDRRQVWGLTVVAVAVPLAFGILLAGLRWIGRRLARNDRFN